MKPNTPEEQIEILRASHQGKAIEMNALENPVDSGWCNVVSAGSYDFRILHYRVKPTPPKEPRTFFLNVYPNNIAVHINRQRADRNATESRIECIEVREVIHE